MPVLHGAHVLLALVLKHASFLFKLVLQLAHFAFHLFMHLAVARLVLNPVLTSIQVSWVKMGIDGAKACLNAGANDMGGTLMNESISRAAGASHGQECPPEVMEQTILSAGRTPRQRTTIYGTPDPERTKASFGAAALVEPLNPHFNDTKLERPKRLIRPGLVGSAK